MSALSFEEMVRSMVAQGVPWERAERVAKAELGEAQRRARPMCQAVADDELALPTGEVVKLSPPRFPLDFTIPHPPRTKKNHGESFGMKQSLGYRRFARQVREWAEEHAAQYGFPLPAIDYAVAVTFYVDNERCDTVGLCQGLFDALQDAGVVPDDKHLRRIQRADWVHDPLLPRAVITLTPI